MRKKTDGSVIPPFVKGTLFDHFEIPYLVIDANGNIQHIHGDVTLFTKMLPINKPGKLEETLLPELEKAIIVLLENAKKNPSLGKSTVVRIESQGEIHYLNVKVFSVPRQKDPSGLFTVFVEKLETKSLGLEWGMEDTSPILPDQTIAKNTLDSIFGAISVGICVTDEKGTFIAVNDRYCTIYGYKRSELIGKNFTMVVPHSERGFLQRLHDEFIKSGKEPDFEAKVMDKEGNILDVEVSASLMVQPNGKRLKITSVKDITSEKRAKRLLEDAQEMAQIGAWEYDVKDQTLDYTPITRKIHGIGEKDKLSISEGLKFYKEGKNRDLISHAFADCMKAGTPFDLELEFISATGGEKWVRSIGQAEIVNNKVVRLYGSIQDITTLKNLEHQVKSMTNNIPGAVIRHKLNPDGSNEISLLSDGAKLIWDLNPADYLKDSNLFWKSVHPDDLPSLLSSMKKSARDLTQWSAEWRTLRKDGSVAWLRGSGNPRRTKDDGTIWDSIILDVTEQKVAKQQLEKTNDELNNILSFSLDIICIFDKKGVFQRISPAAEKILGYRPEDILGKKYLDFVANEDKKASQTIIHQLTSGIPIPAFENNFLKKDGTAVPVIWSANWDSEKELVYAIARDATLIKETEKQLSLNEKLLREAQKLAKIGSWNFDVSTNSLTWSESLYIVFGVDKEYLINSNGFSLNLVIPDDREFVKKTKKNSQLTGDPFNIEYRVITPDGEKRYIEESGYSEKNSMGEVVRWFGTAQNITERKLAEEKILESNQRYEYVTQATSDVIWDWDIHNGKVVWGENYEKIFGKISGEGINDLEKVWQRLHPEEMKSILEHATATLESGDIRWQYDHRYLKSDGRYAFVSNKALIIKNRSGKPIRVIGAMQDVTRHKEELHNLQLMENVIKNTSDAVIIAEAASTGGHVPTIVYVNDAFCRLTGYNKDEAIGKKPDFLHGSKTNFNDLLKLDEALKSERPHEVTLINYKKDGSEYWVYFSISPVYDDKGTLTHWITIQRDVTRQKKENLKTQLLDEISSIFAREENLKTSLSKVLKHLSEFGEFDLAEAWIIGPDKKNIDMYTCHSRTSTSDIFYEYSGKTLSFGKGVGLAGTVWKTKRIEIWGTVSKKAEFLRKKAAIRSGINSMLGIPLTHNQEVVGVLVFGISGSSSSLLFYKDLFMILETFLGGEVKRKQLEEELGELFLTAPDVICIAGADGYFKKINPAACRLLEYEEEELLSKPFASFIHPEDLEKSLGEFSEIKQSQPSNYFENRYLTKSGKTIWLAWSSKFSMESNFVYAIAKDITQQKSLQSLLDRATKLAKIGAWEFNIANKSLSWSTIAKSIHEVEEDFIPQLDATLYFVQEDYQGFAKQKVKNCMEKGIPFDFEVPIVTGKGNKKWVRSIGQAELALGTPSRIYGSFQDITARKDYEESLKTLNQQLEKHAKELALSNDELEQFAYVASHDLQEPLRMITSFLTQLEKKYSPQLDDKAKQYIRFAVDGAKRMRQIILDLLDFSRVGKYEDNIEQIDLAELVDEVCLLQAQAIRESGAKIVKRNLVKIQFFRAPIMQVLQNLIGNAIKYHHKDRPPLIEISSCNHDRHWEILVKDNGIGIESEFYDKIFALFGRLHPRGEYNGTGIGLAIVKKILENLGGKIRVESEIDKGSTFVFTIPKSFT